jgi:hypothetical protein
VLALSLAVSAALAGCASGSGPDGPMLAKLPTSMGGLPADAPARPGEGQLVYPAVHDMPPPRPDPVLTEAQVKAQEAELAKAASRNKKAGSQPVE